MRRLYTALLTVCLPFLFLRWWIRGIRAPAYRARWRERLGQTPFKAVTPTVWVHAVSLGEVNAAADLIRRLRERGESVVVTTTTPTGSAQVQKLFGSKVLHTYFPIDLPLFTWRFLRRAQPRLLILMETELWPNTLAMVRARRIPIAILNARLSEKSMKGYERFEKLSHWMMQQLTIVCSQTIDDARRFERLGMDAHHIYPVGNVKFDVSPPQQALDAGSQLRASFGERRVWVAASTHDGEEHDVIKAHRLIQTKYPDALLILVPRHPERFDEVARMIEQTPVRYSRRSSLEGPLPADHGILLGDTMGEMAVFFAAAEVAFVGGSLVPVGGHNMLEASAQCLPVLTGKHVHNFTEVAAVLTKAKAAHYVRNGRSLATLVCKLFANEALRRQFGQAGVKVVEENRGALDKTMMALRPYLESA